MQFVTVNICRYKKKRNCKLTLKGDLPCGLASSSNPTWEVVAWADPSWEIKHIGKILQPGQDSNLRHSARDQYRRSTN